MKRYQFDLIETNIEKFVEKEHIVFAHSLTDAIQKYTRKHELEAPAYWDEPSFDRDIDLSFKHKRGYLKYKISW